MSKKIINNKLNVFGKKMICKKNYQIMNENLENDVFKV